MRIYLIGFMGSGKTTAGRKLAGKLNLRFMDMDDLLEKKFNKTVGKIFQEEGEEIFRIKENELLAQLTADDDFVLSTGGGVPCYFNNMELMNSSGTTVYLRMNPQALFSRLINVREERPLIKDLDDTQLLKFIDLKLKEREPYYLQAKIITDGLNADLPGLAAEIKKDQKGL